MNKHGGKYQPKTSLWWGKGLSKFPSEYDQEVWQKPANWLRRGVEKPAYPFEAKNVSPKLVSDDENILLLKSTIKRPLLLNGVTSHVHWAYSSPPSYFPASHNICCKHCVPPSDLVFDEENVLPISHPSTIKRYAFAPQRHLVSHCSLGRRPDL